jgi:hypothetical protein
MDDSIATSVADDSIAGVVAQYREVIIERAFVRSAGRQALHEIVAVQMECNEELPCVALARDAPGLFFGANQSWEKQRGEYRNNGDDDQQFNERERELMA